jgi:hypothetical protein
MDPLVGLMEARLQALYRHDERDRLVAINQWDGGLVPRLHLLRTAAGNCWRFRGDLPDSLVEALSEYCVAEPALADPQAQPRHQARYLRLLDAAVPVESIWHGPAYRFPEELGPRSPGIVPIDSSNARLLEPGMPDWLPDVPHRAPFMAVVADAQAVAVCASVRITERVHEAGVETQAGYRRRGFGAMAVRAWAGAVQALGATPLYSTSWDNQASQATAASLGLTLIGTDFHIR